MDFYVYGLVDSTTGKPFYIGKGTKSRWKVHVQRVRRGVSTGNQHLDNKIKKLLSEHIEIQHVKICENLTEDEAYELEEFITQSIGLSNLCNVWEGGFGGRVPSDEVKMRIREGCKKRPEPSESTRRKLSDAKTGTKQSEATKRKKSEALKGKPQTEKQKAANATRGNKGRTFSEEHKAKLRAAKLANPTRYWLNKHHTEATKQKIRDSVKTLKDIQDDTTDE